jgi:CheY-like chemotaxis protein
MGIDETYRTRSAEQLLQAQRDGVSAWQVASRAREVFEGNRRESREAKIDARRRLDALRRANVALVTRSKAVVVSGDVLQDAAPRAVVVHRQDWMRGKLALGLRGQGLRVVAEAADGADGLGISIAEQPDLVLIEDRVPSMTTTEVLRSLREFAPGTVTAAQVEHDDEVGDMLDAGAAAVFSRRMPPAQLCEQIVQFLKAQPDASPAASPGGRGRADRPARRAATA